MKRLIKPILFFGLIFFIRQHVSGSEKTLGLNDTSFARYCLNKGEELYLSQPDSARFYWNKGANFCITKLRKDKLPAEKRTFLLIYAAINNNLGYLYHLSGNAESAIKCFEKGIAIEKNLGREESVAETKINLAFVFQSLGQIEKSLQLLHESIKSLEKSKNLNSLSYALNNLGQIYNNQGDSRKALELYFKSLEIQKKIGDKRGIAFALNNIGYVYKHTGDCKKALEFYQASLLNREEIGDKSGQAQTLINIAALLNECEEFKSSGNFYAECIAKQTRALIISREIKDKALTVSSLISLAYFSMEKKNFSEAEKFAQEAYSLSKESASPLLIARSTERLYFLYRETRQFKKALDSYEEYILMRDSINNDNTKKASIKSQLKYEYEKKATADSVKVAEEKKVVAAQLKQEKTQRFALYGGLGLVGIFAIFMVNRFRVTNKQKKLIEAQKLIVEEQKHIVEEKQKEILDSIRYAKRIQQALVTSERYIARELNRIKKQAGS